MKKCLGTPDLSTGKIIPCDKPAEDGEDWCKECGDLIMERFRNSWADFAQMEAPKHPRSTILRYIDKILGRD